MTINESQILSEDNPPKYANNFPKIKGIDRAGDFLLFASWLAESQLEREPKTQKELAVQLGIVEDRLSDWKHHPQFWQTVAYFWKTRNKERTPAVIKAIYAEALRGNPQSAKLWMQIIEEWKESTETESKGIMKHYVISRGESRVAVIHAASETGGDSDASGAVQGGDLREEVRENNPGDQ